MTAKKPPIADEPLVSGSNLSRRVDDIKKLSELGIPTVISLAVTGLVLWYGIKVFPAYLDRQAKTSEKMANTAEVNAETNAQIQQSMEDIQDATADIKKAAEETVEVERETKVFMEGVRQDHEDCLKDHDKQDTDHALQTEILREIANELKKR